MTPARLRQSRAGPSSGPSDDRAELRMAPGRLRQSPARGWPCLSPACGATGVRRPAHDPCPFTTEPSHPVCDRRGARVPPALDPARFSPGERWAGFRGRARLTGPGGRAGAGPSRVPPALDPARFSPAERWAGFRGRARLTGPGGRAGTGPSRVPPALDPARFHRVNVGPGFGAAPGSPGRAAELEQDPPGFRRPSIRPRFSPSERWAGFRGRARLTGPGGRAGTGPGFRGRTRVCRGHG